MTTKWWKTGLLVVTLLLLIGIASAQAVPARLVDGWDGRTRDTNGNPVPLDGLPATLSSGGWVTVIFDDSLLPVGGSFTVRIYMDGSDPVAVGNTHIEVSAPSSDFVPFLGDGYIREYLDPQPEHPYGLQTDWFQFGTYCGGIAQLQRVRITNLNAGPICISAVSAPPFPVEMIKSLVNSVIALNLQNGIENSLDAKLDAALQALEDLNSNNNASAINKLQAFVSEVNAQSGNKLTVEEAKALVEGGSVLVSGKTISVCGAMPIIESLLSGT